MQKSLGRARLSLIAVILTVLLTGCGSRYIINNTHVLKKADSQQFIIQKTATEPMKSIDISTASADVMIIPSDGYYVEIDYTYWEEEPEYTIENGALTFNDRYCFPDSYSINFNLKNYIKIYVPSDTDLNRIKLDNASGNVNIAGFRTDQLKANISYGNFTVEKAAAVTSEFNLSSGECSIRDFQSDSLDLSNSYGNCHFNNVNQEKTADNLSRIDISMSSGSLDMKGIESNSVVVTNSYGNVEISDMTANDFSASLSSGNITMKGVDISDILISDSYGSASLNLSGAEDDYKFDLNTSYGAIKVGSNSYESNAVIGQNGARKVKADLSSGDITVKFKD